MQLRVTPDTNIVVSSVINEGPPRQVLRAAARRKIILVFSDMSLSELFDVILRPKFRSRLPDFIEAIRILIPLSDVITVRSKSINVIEDDPPDNMILATAVDGGARYIVSGDKHLLHLKQYKGIQIVRARQLLRIIGP